MTAISLMGELMGTLLEGEAASLRDEIESLRRQLGEAEVARVRLVVTCAIQRLLEPADE